MGFRGTRDEVLGCMVVTVVFASALVVLGLAAGVAVRAYHWSGGG